MNEWGTFLRRVTSDLLVEAKHVRRRHLEGLGSQSYGGMVRQHLKGVPSVVVLGAGQLAEEILPWMVGKSDVTVCARNPERAGSLTESSAGSSGAIRIDRTVRGEPRDRDRNRRSHQRERCEGMDGSAANSSREGDRSARCSGNRSVELFAAPSSDYRKVRGLKNERPESAARVAAARDEIRKAGQRLMEQAQFRPFGWEDLCA